LYPLKTTWYSYPSTGSGHGSCRWLSLSKPTLPMNIELTVSHIFYWTRGIEVKWEEGATKCRICESHSFELIPPTPFSCEEKGE